MGSILVVVAAATARGGDGYFFRRGREGDPPPSELSLSDDELEPLDYPLSNTVSFCVYTVVVVSAL